MANKPTTASKGASQILLLVFGSWISVGLCHAVRYAVHQIAQRDPLDNMPVTMVSLFFAYLAVAFALFFAFKVTRFCVRSSTSDSGETSRRVRWFALVAVWVPAGFYSLFWLYVSTNWRWLEWVARV